MFMIVLPREVFEAMRQGQVVEEPSGPFDHLTEDDIIGRVNAMSRDDDPNLTPEEAIKAFANAMGLNDPPDYSDKTGAPTQSYGGLYYAGTVRLGDTPEEDEVIDIAEDEVLCDCVNCTIARGDATVLDNAETEEVEDLLLTILGWLNDDHQDITGKQFGDMVEQVKAGCIEVLSSTFDIPEALLDQFAAEEFADALAFNELYREDGADPFIV
jgi:hypothetical protein